MLNSWFAPKTKEESTSERVSAGTTPPTSFSSPTDNQAPRSSTEKNTKRNYPTIYTTPHDAILADVLGTSRTNDPSKEGRTISSDSEPLGPHENNPTGQQDRASQQPNFSGVLFDPFDGTALGVLVPHQDDPNTDEQSASQINLLDSPERGNASPIGSDTMWSTLSQVLDIQSQISKMHLEMEGIGNVKTGDSKRKRHRMSAKPAPDMAGETPEVAPDDPAVPPGLHQPRKRVSSTISTVSTAGGAEGDEEGVNVPNEEAEKNRIREEEFAKLTTQFEGRKEAINGIMGKLDDLSQALHKFHHLSYPAMDIFSFRNGSYPPNSTPPQSVNEDEVKRDPEFQYTEHMNTSGWKEANTTSSSSIPQAPPLDRTKSDTIIIGAPLKRSAPEQRAIPTLMVNSVDLETQTRGMDSPNPNTGSL
ncbi:hypothetical protein CPB84DRAFT_1841539 [Gymnopilus junonius]|uniref:Uncharacterized protein n=1 Tax=Gymnopilus junonius TaxID=109634 RepID=A0A9P5TTV7_GYMJU|nr:hypothetical protein CPB84DRAFT_1841539 [Gymnopilus junonius]